MPEIATDVKGFVEWVIDVVYTRYLDGDEDEVYGPWFRGHADAAWLLRPRLYRDGALEDRADVEKEVREEFIVRAPALSDSIPATANTWDWYFLMQHYGAPTRLLDWTEGALVALWFAVKGKRGDFDAAVWALDPYDLNEQVIDSGVVSPLGTLSTDAKGVKRASKWEVISKHLPPKPIAVLPIHNVRRIATQRSCFTVHGSDPDGLEQFYREDRDGCLDKIVIPRDRVLKIRRDLEVCGVDETTLFPDLEGLGRTVSARWGI